MLLLLAALATPVVAQDQDTIWFTEKKPKEPTVFHFYQAGLAFADGNIQYFDGFSQEVLYTNSRSGLPLYSDWMVFSGFSVLPKYYSFYGSAGFADTTKNLRLRFGGGFYHKEDSLYYTGGYAVHDTIFIRTGSEAATYFSAHVAGLKTSRKLLHVLRLYTGAELELGFAPTSRVRFHEYEYDFGEDKILHANHFNSTGKARANVLGTAIVGVEAVFGSRIGFHAEARSGIGLHWVPKQGAYGLSRIGYQVGMNLYFLDH